jgi:hypothetical protein
MEATTASSGSVPGAETAFEVDVCPRWLTGVEQDIRLFQALVDAAAE